MFSTSQCRITSVPCPVRHIVGWYPSSVQYSTISTGKSTVPSNSQCLVIQIQCLVLYSVKWCQCTVSNILQRQMFINTLQCRMTLIQCPVLSVHWFCKRTVKIKTSICACADGFSHSLLADTFSYCVAQSCIRAVVILGINYEIHFCYVNPFKPSVL